jgi:prophage regulatory protein
MSSTKSNLNPILRLPAVMEATGFSRSSIYAYVQAGKFPSPIHIGDRAVGWKSSEIFAWLEQRAELRGAK